MKTDKFLRLVIVIFASKLRVIIALHNCTSQSQTPSADGPLRVSRQTDRQMDKCYQVHYLSSLLSYTIDENREAGDV